MKAETQSFIGVPGATLPVETNSLVLGQANLHAHRVRARLAGEGRQAGLQDLLGTHPDVDSHPAHSLVPCHALQSSPGRLFIGRQYLRELLTIDFRGTYPSKPGRS